VTAVIRNETLGRSRIPRLPRIAQLRNVVAHHPHVIVTPIVVLGLLAVWQGAVALFNVPEFILPPPALVWRSLASGLSHAPLDTGGYWYHAGVTIFESLLGFALGSLVGTVLGFALAQWRSLEVASYPFIVAFQALPKVALAPLLVIWFGFGFEGKVYITTIITFFPVLVGAMSGAQSVDPDRIELARSCNADDWQIFRKIILPSSLPYLFAGLNVASALAVLGAIVGEFVGAKAGLGMLLMQYNQAMEIAPVFGLLLILGIIGFAMNYAIKMLERRFCFWAQRRSAKPAR
jgi:NitT/TauT family transport system permease protein